MEIKCVDCPYSWEDEDTKIYVCEYPWGDSDAPCERED